MIRKIKNFELLERSSFKTFHDAEVLEIVLKREEDKKQDSKPPFIRVKLSVFIKFVKNFQIDNQNWSHWRKAFVELEFTKIDSLIINDFNHQNVLNDLHIAANPDSDSYDVWFESIFGCDVQFNCLDMEVINVEEFESKSKSIEKTKEELKKIRKAYQKFRSEK